MIIDLILDRRDNEDDIRDGYDFVRFPNGQIVSILYDPHKFYTDVVGYGEIGDDIARAMDGGTEEDVKRALCEYIDSNGYNPGIKKYINSRDWLTPSTMEDDYTEVNIMSSRKIIKTPIKSAYVADPNLDPRFDFEIDDNFEVYDRIGICYCQVIDYVSDGRNAAVATIAVASEDDYFGADQYVESGIEEYFDSMTNGTDYGFNIRSVERVLYEPSYFRAYDMQNYDDTFNHDYNYNWFIATVEVFAVSDSDDFWEAD